MHDGMQYDLIRGIGQGHEPMKVGRTDGHLRPTNVIRSTRRSLPNEAVTQKKHFYGI